MQLRCRSPRPEGAHRRDLRRAIAVVGGLAGVLALVACAGDPATPEDRPGGVGSPPGCDPELDLAETAFGPYSALNQIPVTPPEGEAGEGGFWREFPSFQINHIDNHFDPCAELSWIVLSGATDQDPAGTESTALLLFHRDQLLRDPLPIQVSPDLSVARVSGAEITISYESLAAGAAHQAEPHTATLQWEDDTLTRDDLSFRRDYARQLNELDLDQPVPRHENPVLPLGNAHHRPFTAEYELAEYPGSNVRIRIDEDSELLCVLRFAEHHEHWGWVGCAGQGVEWPYVAPPFAPPPGSEDSVPGAEESANYLRISLEPAALASAYFSAERMPDFPVAIEVEADALTRVGSYLIDTRGGDPRLIYGGTAIEIREDGFDSGPANILDRSRW